MAWLARSIANSLLAPEEDEPSSSAGPGTSASPGSSSPPRGVREDLSELTGALANRFQGLASFLAPAATPGGDGVPRVPDPAEIAGRFRAGLARLPGRQAVADLAKIASSLLPPEGDADWAEAAVGVTEEVVAFARDAALRHELWLDFPLLPDDADSDDFDMTDAQQDHALAVESVAPELADLRIELCPSHMSEGCFWKIYFVLLHPKLRKEDAAILSTPQILEARGRLSHDLQYQTKLQSSNEDSMPVPFSNVDGALTSPVEAVGALKGQDGSVMTTSFSNIDYLIPQSTKQEFVSTNATSDPGTVSSDSISSSVPVQLLPVLKGATVVSQSRMEENTCSLSTEDAAAAEQSMQLSDIALVDNSPPKDDQQKQPCDLSTEDAAGDEHSTQLSEIALVDNSPPKDDQQKQPLADISEQSRVDIQKAYHDEDDDGDDGDEWLEEETGGPGSTTIPIADDEDVSFSDLEDDDGTT